MRTDIAWTALPWPSVEHVIIDEGDGWRADGSTVAVLDGRAVRLTYLLQVDAAGATRALDVAEAVGGATLALRSDGRGRWWDGDGAPLPALDGCIDVDI
jgi:uncharacterized protein